MRRSRKRRRHGRGMWPARWEQHDPVPKVSPPWMAVDRDGASVLLVRVDAMTDWALVYQREQAALLRYCARRWPEAPEDLAHEAWATVLASDVEPLNPIAYLVTTAKMVSRRWASAKAIEHRGFASWTRSYGSIEFATGEAPTFTADNPRPDDRLYVSADRWNERRRHGLGTKITPIAEGDRAERERAWQAAYRAKRKADPQRYAAHIERERAYDHRRRAS